MASKRKHSGSKTTRQSCERSGGRWAKFPGGRTVCFTRDSATASTKKKRLSSLKKARKALPKKYRSKKSTHSRRGARR